MFDSFFRKAVLKKLGHLNKGCIVVSSKSSTTSVGDPDTEEPSQIEVVRNRMFRRILARGDVGAAESYMDGDWECDDLTKLIRIMISNLSTTDQLGRGLASIRRVSARCLQVFKPNNRHRARTSIHQHYDLGNEFFSTFLDETMSYSSAIFETPNDTLGQASLNKLRRTCDKLQLTPNHHLLEIGTGWGGLAIFAAQNYGCRVTTTTISTEQFQLATQRVKESGLEHRITVLNQDYRDLEGKYDRIVSIEMIEAVGHRFLNRFFEKCDSLLCRDGLMLIQAIVIRDQRFRFHTQNIDFMRKYIFPGGCLPSVTSLLNAMTEGSQLRMLHLEDIVSHYPPTLRAWLQNFDSNEDAIRELGIDDPFIRMWRFYLCYCEAAFLERQVNNIQGLFAAPDCRFDPTNEHFVSGRHSSNPAEDTERGSRPSWHSNSSAPIKINSMSKEPV